MDKFNVIYVDEDVVGKVRDIKKLMIYQLSKDLQEDIDIVEKIDKINMTQALLEDLEGENDNTIIKVLYNQMGCFNYKDMIEEE